eukprot:scaffold262637_cov49-Attheya_sp.AAC.4
MLVGNDFLPHAPYLEIDNGDLNLLLGSYMDLMMDDWNGFLTHKEKIHPERLESLLYKGGVQIEDTDQVAKMSTTS